MTVVGSYELDTSIGQVRLLLNDVDPQSFFFADTEVQAFLDLEGGSVKRAAAQAIDTNADSEILAAKVLRSQDVGTDGAKVADALRKRAALLRQQAEEEDGFLLMAHTPLCTPYAPELTEWPTIQPWPHVTVWPDA